MLKNQKPEPGVVGACVMTIVLFLGTFIFMLPVVFSALWLFGDWSLAVKYVMPSTTTFAALISAVVSSLPVSARKTRLSVFGLAACGLFIYFTLINSFEFSSIGEVDEPVHGLTESERFQIRLDIECRDIGFRYARAALASFNGVSSGRDVVIPSKCRGRAATQEGMRLAN